MITRKTIEEREYRELSPCGTRAAESRGRMAEEEPCSIRTDFQRDRDRIIHSKSFRRLMHKTQVFLAPEGDHFRTRLTHTIEVSQIARTIARGCGLNEDLTEAIAMGHDLGHTPFGHSGESVLNRIYPGGFRHNEQSLRVVDVLESGTSRRGMNLTMEVRDGILNHTGPVKPFTVEGQVVKISDRIAYINHDIDDALRSGVIRYEDLPAHCIEILGSTHKERINTLVTDMIEHTWNSPEARMSDEKLEAMNDLRSFMFRNVYNSSFVRRVENMDRIDVVIESLFDYFMENQDELPTELLDMKGEYPTDELVKDHVAGMTDRYALNLYNRIFVPAGWK